MSPSQQTDSELSENLSASDSVNPVKVGRDTSTSNDLLRLLASRHNILACWPDLAYRKPSFDFQLLRQHYFVCNSPDSVRRVFLEEHDNYDRKSPQMRHALEPLLGDGMFVSDGELWRQRRESCAPAFENDLLPDFSTYMVESAQELVEHWEKQLLSGIQQVDMLNEMARLTARIIARTIFGDDISDDEASQVVDGFSEYQENIDHISFADAFGLPLIRWLSNPFRYLRTKRSAHKVHAVIDRIIDRYSQSKKSGRITLLSLLLENNDAGKSVKKKCPLNFSSTRNEAIVMFMAGHETTANVLTWAWYLLDKYPNVATKLYAELDSVLGGNPPTYEMVSKLPYTRAVLEETLRLYPPVPLLSRHARSSDRIHNQEIKSNTIILVVPWLLHRHELYWEKPDSFIPERFLNGTQRPDNFLYIPFSAGRRICLGKRFAIVESILCLATLAQHFRPKVVLNHEVNIECRLTLRPKGGLPMNLELRR
jgi:cytochrome P450